MYTDVNYKTKKALIEAVKRGDQITVYNPGPFGSPPKNGKCAVEGPHYPKPHSWYAQVTVTDGVITGVK